MASLNVHIALERAHSHVLCAAAPTPPHAHSVLCGADVWPGTSVKYTMHPAAALPRCCLSETHPAGHQALLLAVVVVQARQALLLLPHVLQDGHAR